MNNIKAIEDHLFGRADTGETLLFEANMILNSNLREDVQHQQNTYAAIKQYSRKQLKAEIATVQQKLTGPQHQGFMQRIINLFKKS
ncbi:hypothetical protein BEL04_12185 [Mucilaginibacter sp. PPCGB 2223]|nr:hypothetical protein BEL04_12185 [Mucilaginibacter sp. PPCGB 2223]